MAFRLKLSILVIGSVGLLYGCVGPLHDGGSGGATSSASSGNNGTTVAVTSASTTSIASTGAGSTTCVLDTSKLDGCTLQ
jgi:hypothetical protein